ncbi:hypothetical protein HN511_04000 [bacterium]|jgi:hypothetical protein|nr:hypothetical protein [bacterium]
MKIIRLSILIFLSFIVGSFCADQQDILHHLVGARVKIKGSENDGGYAGKLGILLDIEPFVDTRGRQRILFKVQLDGWDRDEFVPSVDVIILEVP